MLPSLSAEEDLLDAAPPLDRDGRRWTATADGARRMKRFTQGCYNLVKSELGLIILLVCYAFIGAVIFLALERDAAAAEAVKRASVKDEFLNELVRLSFSIRSEEEQELANITIMKFLHGYEISRREGDFNETHNATSTDVMEWNLYTALFFCGTIFTTVGYGNIVPVTEWGRIVTMMYAAIGIPLCLIVLTKVGRKMTKCMKFFWSFIRRLYFTGSCRKIRKITSIRRRVTFLERMTRRFRATKKEVKEEEEGRRKEWSTEVTYDVDDVFNLPPIVALIVAFVYIMLGTFLYRIWEKWTYLESFYFIFTSLCTIGFGDVLPSHPKNFIASSAYLLLGLALIAMVINVLMEYVNQKIVKATDQVKQVGHHVKQFSQTIIRTTPGSRQDASSSGQRSKSGSHDQSAIQGHERLRRLIARRHSF